MAIMLKMAKIAKIAKTAALPAEEVSVANAKNRLSELLGRVAYGGVTVHITRRGKPMAKLVPFDTGEQIPGLADVTGWLDDAHPFFGTVDDVVAARKRHVPRVLKRPNR